MRKFFAVSTLLLCAGTLVSGRTSKPKPPADYTAFRHKLPKDDQIVHALDRLTFGPKPGDVEAVRKLGLKKWIDLQLHPERIPENPEVARRLEPLESLRMSQSDAERNYPNPQTIRAIATGRQAMPEDPVTRAAVERVIRRLKARKDPADPNATEPVTPLDQILTRDEIRALRTGTPDQKREFLAAIPESKIDDLVIALPAGLRFQLMPVAEPALRRKMMLMTAPQQLIAYDLSEGKLARAIFSSRQLEEQLADFWYNHFNVYLDKGADRFLVPSYEREAIRPNLLGRFRDLLEATAQSPAMLFYLDNWESVGPDTQRRPANAKRNIKQPPRGLNENYARELMELHTLGVDGGYTQKDVTEVARCFTGWTIRPPQQGGDFFYNDRVHDKGEKMVLGVRIPAGGGRDDAEKVLDILAAHPSTAHFISRKLAQRFVADDPPPELVEKMARKFHESHGDLRAVMKTMLASNEFFSQGAYRAKVKTPFEMIVSAVRATGAQVDTAFPLANQIAQMGEPLYRKLEPTGYSSANVEWVNSAALLGRMNFALALVQNRVPGVKVDASKFGGEPGDIARQVLFRDATPETRAAIEKALADQHTKNPDAARNPAMVAGLVLGSPDFQKR
jgi:uncharacterized protein (DUF1800 family)